MLLTLLSLLILTLVAYMIYARDQVSMFDATGTNAHICSSPESNNKSD